MIRMLTRAVAACTILVTAVPAAWAEDVALILANERYDQLPRVAEARTIAQLAGPLREAGFRTVLLRDLSADDMLRDLPEALRDLDAADRVVVVTAGQYGTAAGSSWLLGTDTARAGLLGIARSGLSLNVLYDLAAAKAGDALFVVATPETSPDVGWRVTPGFRDTGVPQGVTLTTGPAADLVAFVSNELLVPGRPMAEAAAAAPPQVSVTGYVPLNRAFLSAASTPPDTERPDFVERAMWQRAVSADTVAAYESYLHRYPRGLFAETARQRIADLSLTPADRARMDEEQLNLSRERRQGLQEYLTILGYDTRGIDGVFGPNTRNAIRRWQASVGNDGTGYLTANQVTRIERDGAARAEQLRREAERRRREQEREDRDFWQRTGAQGDGPGLRAYLDRYPDGLFADQAQASLDAIEREQRRQAEAAERQAWDDAARVNTADSYERYLQFYPNGRFVDEAQARIANLRRPETPPQAIAAARAEEESLNLDPVRRRLIESQLASMGLEPGQVDGRFDAETRRALRRFQRANEMPVTGFATRDTIVRLIASALQP